MSVRPKSQADALLSLLATALLLIGLTGCGGGDSEASGPTTTGNTGSDGEIGGDIVDPNEDAGNVDAGGIENDTGGNTDIDIDGGSGEDVDGGGTVQPDGLSADGSDGGPDDPDANITPIDCPGGAFCDCEKNDDCDSAFCVDTAGGKKCAMPCVSDCPGGYTCSKYGSVDPVFLCLPDHLTLCAPCLKDGDCKFQGAESLCLDYGTGGKFCGSGCNQDSDCPKAYGCIETKDAATGSIVKQCKLSEASDGSQPLCDCTKWASSVGAKTSCAVSNDLGSCTGERGCSDKGLTACTAPTPVTEVCDSMDNDCDGQTDDLPKSVTCGKKSWFDVGTKAACKSDADCSASGESCEPDSGTCRVLIGECMGTPECDASGKMVCKDVKTPKSEMCNGEDDDCDGPVDEDFQWESPVDGAKVSIGGACGLGSCAGGTVKCDTLSAVLCDAEKKKSNETCDGDDNDCDGATDEDTCVDGNLCTKDDCNPATADCSNPPAVECDDKNVCTKDSCDSKTGQCVFAFLDASCDDGDACSVGDKCGTKADGTATCLPGAVTQGCDDDNACTDDSCDANAGCANLPNAVTVVCYTAQDASTAGQGKCQKGVQFCKAGKLEFECVGEVLPKLSETCDGTDDDCDGETDEGCKSAQVDASFATSWATVKNMKNGKSVTVELGGTSPVGDAKGKAKTAEFGFISWVFDLLSK